MRIAERGMRNSSGCVLSPAFRRLASDKSATGQVFLNADQADRADFRGSEKKLIRSYPPNPPNPRSKKAWLGANLAKPAA